MANVEQLGDDSRYVQLEALVFAITHLYNRLIFVLFLSIVFIFIVF